MSLGKKVFSSAFLLFARKIWSNAINLVVMAFLARILSKEDFGLLAISSVFLSIINTFATSGIAEYVVYYDGDDQAVKANAAFWLNLFLTIAVAGVVIAIGPHWASYYHHAEIYPMLLLLTWTFLFEMNGTVPKALLRKELDYKTIVYYSGIAMTVVSLGKLVSAWAGLGAFSLALPQAVVSPFLMLVFYVRTTWKPSMRFELSQFASIFKFSRHIIGGRVLTKLVNEGDNLIVGKIVGLEGLGIYALAFQLANLATTNIVLLANDLFLPVFSKVKHEYERMRSVYLRTIRALSFLSFPIISIVVISAEPIVSLIYGQKWIDAVLPLQVLCFFALGRSLSSPSSALFGALGKPEIGFRFTLWFTPIFLLSVYLGSHFGIIGVAVSTTVVRLVGSVVSLSLSSRLLELTLLDLFQTVKSNIFAMAFVLTGFLVATLAVESSSLKLSLVLAPLLGYAYFLFQRMFFLSDLRTSLLELDRYVHASWLTATISKLLFIRKI